MPASDPTTPLTNVTALNTDRELWREPPGDYYANSIHVTEGGGIGINVGGLVMVKTLREWHRLAIVVDRERALLDELAAEKAAMAERRSWTVKGFQQEISFKNDEIAELEAELAAAKAELALMRQPIPMGGDTGIKGMGERLRSGKVVNGNIIDSPPPAQGGADGEEKQEPALTVHTLETFPDGGEHRVVYLAKDVIKAGQRASKPDDHRDL